MVSMQICLLVRDVHISITFPIKLKFLSNQSLKTDDTGPRPGTDQQTNVVRINQNMDQSWYDLFHFSKVNDLALSFRMASNVLLYTRPLLYSPYAVTQFSLGYMYCI